MVTLITDDKGKILTSSDVKQATNAIETSLEQSHVFSWVEKHFAFVALCLTAVGTILNFYVYIYYFSYAFYWNMQITDIDINTTNTIFAFLVQVIVSVIFLYLAYLWARQMYVSKLCKWLSIIGLSSPYAVILATTIIYFTNIFSTIKIPLLFRQIVVCLAFVSSFSIVFLFIGSEIYKSTKEYKKEKLLKNLKNKVSDKSKTQKVIKDKPLPAKLLIILIFTTAYLGGASFFLAFTNTSFDIVAESKSSTYAVLSHKDKSVYAVKCEIQDNNITLHPSIHKLIPSDNLVIQKQTFASVSKAY